MPEIHKDEYNSKKEQEELRRRWDEARVELTEAKSGLKELSHSLDEASKAGADKETMDMILEKWQGYSDRVTELEKELLHLDREMGSPDPFKDFVKRSRDNVEKGAHILGDKVRNIVDKIRHDKDGNPRNLTGRIVQAHQNVSAVFHEKQAEISKKLHEGLEKIQGVMDEKKLDAWVRAVDRAETLNSGLNAKKNNIEINRTTEEQNILRSAEIKKEKIGIAFEKKAETLYGGGYTRGERFAGGFKTMLGATIGSGFKDYFADPKPDEKIQADVDKARKAMKSKSDFADRRAGLKIIFLKTWAKMQVGFQNLKAKLATNRANRLEKELGKNPRTKDVAELIKQSAAEAKNFTQARENVKTMDGKDKTAKDTPEPGR